MPRMNSLPPHSLRLAPTSPMLSSAAQALVKVGNYLRAQNYRFVTVTPNTHARMRATSHVWARNLRDIFGWSKPFHADTNVHIDTNFYQRTNVNGEATRVYTETARAATDVIPRSLFALLRAGGVLHKYRDGWYCGVRFSTVGSLLLMHSAFPTDADDAVFLGPDTYRFCTFIQDFLERHALPLQRVADIGCGSGAAAITIARHYPTATVHALDINAQALQHTRINAALAGADNVAVGYSDLLDDTDGEFDLIVANPPYMVDAAQRSYRHGGELFGAEFSLRLFDNAVPRLRAGGSLLLYTGTAIVDGEDVFLHELQTRLARADLSWSYREIDPDVFGEEIGRGAYAGVERIAVVGLIVTRNLHTGEGTVCTH